MRRPGAQCIGSFLWVYIIVLIKFLSYEEKRHLKQATSDPSTRFIGRQLTPKGTINYLVPNIFVFFIMWGPSFFSYIYVLFNP